MLVYPLINRLPRRWRFKAQRIWMHVRDFRDSVWAMPAPDMAIQGLLTFTFTVLAVAFFKAFGDWLLAIAAFWLLFLFSLAIAKAIFNLFR